MMATLYGVATPGFLAIPSMAIEAAMMPTYNNTHTETHTKTHTHTDTHEDTHTHTRAHTRTHHNAIEEYWMDGHAPTDQSVHAPS